MRHRPQRVGPIAIALGLLSGTIIQADVLVLRDGTYRYQAGAGLVADSKPEAEHAEVVAKSGALLAALRLAAEGL